MAQSSPLNKLPSGLLDFFGIKSGVWGPRELGQLLQPQLDLWRHYVCANSHDFDGTIATINGALSGVSQNTVTFLFPKDAAGGVPPSTVPEDELWYWDTASLHCQLSTGAGSTVSMLTMVEANNTLGRFTMLPFAPVGTLTSNAAGPSAMHTTLQYPCFLRPGSLLQVYSSFNVAATETLDVRCTARGVRMKL